MAVHKVDASTFSRGEPDILPIAQQVGDLRSEDLDICQRADGCRRDGAQSHSSRIESARWQTAL